MTKKHSIAAAALVLSVMTAGVAQAETLQLNVGVNANATSSAAKNKNTTSTHETASSTPNKSTVATFVNSLHMVANREGGIGAEVRKIARSQNDSASSTARAMAHVDNRTSVKTFFAGSDYRNLGVLRSEIASTTNNITRLAALLNRTIDPASRAELTLQLNALQAENMKIEAYIKAHENKFSLFGWFARLFVK